MSESKSIATENVTTLASQCLQHLRQESTLLEDVNQALLKVRDALVQGNHQDLSAALDSQNAVAAGMQQLREARLAMRSQLSRRLDVPVDQATVRWLANRSPHGVRDQLMNERSRLIELVQQTHRLIRGNVVLAGHGADLIRRMMECLTDSTAPPERYDQAGRKTDTPVNSVLKARY